MAPPEPRISLVRSVRGAQQLCIDGFIYSKNKATLDKTYWECVLRKRQKNAESCHAKAITTVSTCGALTLQSHSDHNNATRAEKSHVLTARAHIKDAAMFTKNKPCQILQTQQATAGNLAVAISPHMPTKNALRKVISRVRHIGKPKEPQTLDEINIPEELKNTISAKKFMQREIDIGDIKLLIFTTEDDMRCLERCKYWMADGTFKTAPGMFMQLFTIHGCIGGMEGQTQPRVYVLMTRRTNECYDQIMQALNEIAAE